MTDISLSDILIYIGSGLLAVGWGGIAIYAITYAFALSTPLGFFAMMVVGIVIGLIGCQIN